MDEIFFHISQHWETLQVHLFSALQQSRRLSIALGEHLSQHAQTIRNSSWNELLQMLIQRSRDVVRSFSRHFSTVLAQPTEMCYQLTEFAKMEMPIIYPGSAGLVTGAVLGIIIGLSWQRNVFAVQRMHAVVCMAYDGLDALSYVDDAIIPTITKSNQLVVNVKSASVDIIDIKICYGYGKNLRRLLCSSYNNMNHEFPVTLGRDCSGIVVEIGPDVKKFEIGDEVWLVSPFWNCGTIAEYVLTSEDMVGKKPRNLSFEAAASLPYSGCLAYDACLKAGILTNTNPETRVLIHSGVSPVGCIVSQIARLKGCVVTVICSARAAPVARALGAHEVITYGEMEMENILSRKSFDVVVNTVGGVSRESCDKLCRFGGKVVSTVPEKNFYNDVLFPMALFRGISLKVQHTAKRMFGDPNKWTDVEFSGKVLENLGELVQSGNLQHVVDKVFAPQDAILALQHCDSADAIGKTVIRFSYRNGR